MAKRLLSMLLSLALLLSCISGITLFTMAEDPSAPIGYFDFGGNRGAVQKSGGVVRPIMANNNENTSDLRGGSAIGTTGLYGYKITREGFGVYFGGTLLNAVPDGTGVTYAVNYYIDSETPLTGDVLLVTDGVNGEKNFADLAVGEQGTVYYSLSAAAVDAIQANEAEGDTRLRMKALGEGAGKLYITGVTILSSFYCTAETANADTVAALHEHMLADEVNIELRNAKAGSPFEAGYTGDTVCISCETVLAAGEEIPAKSDLPAPYAWMETEGGVKTSNVCTGWGDEAWSEVPVSQIPGTAEYGVKLTGDWQGFFIGGNLFAGIPADRSLTMVVEYYITGDMSERQQLFRYQVNNNPHKDMYTDTEKLVGGRSSLFYHTFTAEERAAAGEGDVRFKILGCEAGTDRVYIQSIYLVDTEYLNLAEDNGYAVLDREEQVLCDYYPDITVTKGINTDSGIHEVSPTFHGFEYINVYGDVCAADRVTNKPIYIKVYAAEGYENDSVHINSFEVSKNGAQSTFSGDQGIIAPPINFVDGMGAIVLNACFNNGLNGIGSLRFEVPEAKKIARIEFYDLSSFCLNEKASAEDITAIHAVLAANNMFVEKVGRVEATEETTGYTGDTVCTLCDTVAVKGIEIPVIDPNRPAASLDTKGGTLVYDGCTLSIRDNGNYDVVAIGDTDEHGILLTGDWNGFNMDGISMLGVSGRPVMLIEYYLAADFAENSQVFRYQINNMAQVDLFTTENNLVSRQSGLIYHIFTDDELAAIGDNAFTFRVMGCAAGANVAYIQSVKLVSTELLNLEADMGYVYTEFTGKPLTALYPDILAVPSYNMTYADKEQHPDHPDRDWLYRYFMVSGNLLAENGVSKPVYIKVYAAEGHENDTVTIGAIERTAGSFGASETIQMTEGVGAAFISSTCFTNGLNGSGSLRVFWEEAEKITRIEIYNAADYCVREDADAELVELFHEEFKADLVNVNRIGKVDPTEEAEGYTGDIYCAACEVKLAEGMVIPKLEVSDLPTPYAYFDTANGIMRSKDMTLADQGSPAVASPIGGSGEYGIKLTGDWQGFRMEGLKLPEGKDVTMVIEYYIDAQLTNKTQLFRIQAYENMPGDLLDNGTDTHWDDIFSDENAIVSRDSGLLFFHFDEEHVAAINGGEFTFRILGCGPGANITYIQSVRLIDSKYVTAGGDLGYDYMSFVETPLCEYYPTITGTQSSGMSLSKTEEGVDDNGAVRYGYFKVTRALAGPDAVYRPVVIRFRFKEGFEVESFQLDYQTKRRLDPSDGTEWAHATVQIVDGAAEILLEEACLDNGLNGLGSIRMPNHPSIPAVDNLEWIEVVGLADTTLLQKLVDGVEDAVIGKTKETADAYRAVVAEYAALLEDVWVNEADVNAAVEAIQAAAEAMEDCLHEGATKLVGALEVGNHVVPGYTGDEHCAECNLLLKKGEVIREHETEFRNITDPTCKDYGNSGDLWCLDCDELVTAGDTIMKLPHKWNDGEVTKPATPTTKGEITITCTVCGETRITRFDFVPELGDVNGDGEINSTDARLVLQFAVRKIAPTELDLDLANVDGNDKVDSTDARLILQYAVRKIDQFPA